MIRKSIVNGSWKYQVCTPCQRILKTKTVEGKVEADPTMIVMRDVKVAHKKELGEHAITKIQVGDVYESECLSW